MRRSLVYNIYFSYFLDISIFIQTAAPADFDSVLQKTFLEQDFCVNEEDFQQLPDNSLVILDDFSFKTLVNKQIKIDFLKIINYRLRHHKITLILIIHNLYNNSLMNDILLSPHIFVSYTNLGFIILR
jgi:hypothetical protein